MLLSQIFDHLTYGELSQLSMGGAHESGIVDESYPAVVSHLNLGLIELYKRFPIKVKTIDIQQYAAIDTYILAADYGQAGSQGTLYLLDAADPFVDTVLKIESITDDKEETDGKDLPLNDFNDEDSLHTVAYNSFKVPEPDDITIMTASFRAAHDIISATDLDPTVVEVHIPYSLLEALIYFMASRAHSSVPLLDGQNEGNVYLQKFEASCKKVEELSLITNDNTSNVRPWVNGWV